MKGIMFNTKYGLEQAVLNGTKTRTWRADKEPRYKIGEIVAIKQCYFDVLNYHKKQNNVTLEQRIIAYYSGEKGWRNKMFTRNEEMPHKIKITGIKQCRLQDLTDEECLKEGIYRTKYEQGNTYTYTNNKLGEYSRPIGAFRDLIRTLNKKSYWESNPLGYAYEFELIK
jgi:uncharacterized protein YqfB (UPF0267 family)